LGVKLASSNIEDLIWDAATYLLRHFKPRAVSEVLANLSFSEVWNQELSYHEGPHVEFWYPMKGSVEIHIAGAYEVRDRLKRRGYRFDPGSKTWYRLLGWKRLVSEELDFLESLGVKVRVGDIVWPVNEHHRKLLERLADKARELGERLGVDPVAILEKYADLEAQGSAEMPGQWTHHYARAFILYLRKLGLI